MPVQEEPVIFKKLEELTEAEGWYLQTCEAAMVEGRILIRGLVRFPCRPPASWACFDDGTLTAEKVMRKIKEYVYDKEKDVD